MCRSWRATGQPLGDRHGHDAGDGGVGDGVDDQRPARPQHAAALTDGSGQIGHVLQDFSRRDHIGRFVPERQGKHVASQDVHQPVPARHLCRGGRQIHTHMRITRAAQHGREETSPAGDIEEDRSRPRRRGDEGCSRAREPVKHREPAAGFPPLAGEFLVLGGVVARPGRAALRLADWLAHKTEPD
jgi:hypothetical protein